MREWNLQAGDPLCLTLAADARLSDPDYSNDQIWELSLTGGEPPALTLQTSYGLRASWMRLFPRFVRGGLTVSNPAMFARPPVVTRFFPNYLAVVFSPFAGIEVKCEYWAAGSQVVTGRVQVTNKSVLKETLRLEWAAVLSPLGEGESMHAVSDGAPPILQGRTENLRPVLLFSGVPQACASPFPALAFDLELFPGNTRSFNWALGSLADLEGSIELARRTLAASWEAEVARISLTNQQYALEITTGNPDWDAALAFTQKTAYSLFFPGGQHLPHPSFVQNRSPDQGFSHRSDGSDYPFSWKGQSGLNALHLAGLIIPGGEELVKGLLENFLHTQDESGAVDWKPGLAGQRGRYLAQPVLATLACQVGNFPGGLAWLSEQYPRLLQFFKAWLGLAHDRDGDGYPEWDHPLQTGYEDNLLFGLWHPQSQGVDVSTLESPALASLLYREAISLGQIARLTGQTGDLDWLEAQAERLSSLVEETWDEASATYHFRDYQTHGWHNGRALKGFQGSGDFLYAHSFPDARRLLLRAQTTEEATRPLRVRLCGQAAEGEIVEEIQPYDFHWISGEGRATTRNAYLSIERVEIQGLDAKDRLRVWTVDLSQEVLPLLLPLWAGIPKPERAEQIVEKTLLPRYLSPAGIPMVPVKEFLEEANATTAVSMGWNTLIGEGLLRYGRREEAARLVIRLMETTIRCLKEHGTFRQFYQAANGQPSGDRNSLNGLAPLGLFLQTLGIETVTPQEIILRGNNPFPWPITVQYRGVRVTRQGSETLVTYPGGQSVTLNGPGPYRISLQ